MLLGMQVVYFYVLAYICISSSNHRYLNTLFFILGITSKLALKDQ